MNSVSGATERAAKGDATMFLGALAIMFAGKVLMVACQSGALNVRIGGGK